MILIVLLLTSVTAIYILHTKGIAIEKQSYFVVEINQSDYNLNSQIVHNGSIAITKLYDDSALFDVFLLDQVGYQCYLQAYYNSSWEQECFFLFNTSQTSLVNVDFNQNYTVWNAERFLVIDNTPFPQNGAYFADRLYLQVDFI